MIMVDFIHYAQRYGVWASIGRAMVNIALALGVVALVVNFETPWLAVGLVALSKWRVLSVRPRYWWANILRSLPDFVVSLATVMLVYYVGISYDELIRNGMHPTMNVFGFGFEVDAKGVQYGIAAVYAVWLAFIKPLTSERAILWQAGISQVVGLMSLFTIARFIPAYIVVLLTFVIGFAAARQTLGQHDESARTLLASAWGLLLALLGFVCWHWDVQYPLISVMVPLPQITIFASVLSFITVKVYRAWADDRKVTWAELGAPVVFAIATTLAILIFFSRLFELNP